MNRLLPILLFTVAFSFQSLGQDSRGSDQDPGGKIVKLYPNPAQSYVTFDVPKGQKGLSITVFNFLGKKMAESQNVGSKTTFALTDFNRGMYIYHLSDASGKVLEMGKFQVSK